MRLRSNPDNAVYLPLANNNDTVETGYVTIIYRTGYLFVLSYILTWTFPSVNRIVSDVSGYFIVVVVVVL